MEATKLLYIIKKIFLLMAFISFPLGAYQILDGVPDPMNTWVAPNYTGNVVHPITGIAPVSWEEAKNLGFPSYFIDSSHPLATNSDNTFGSPDKPRSTIPEITYEPGSYIEINGGPYDGGGQIIFRANGTPDKPVWFRGASIENRAKISGETIVKGEYVILENLEFIGQKLGFRPHNDSYLHHAVIRNSLFYGDGSVAKSSSATIAVKGRTEQRFHDIVIYNNEIHSYGKSFVDTDPGLGESTENDFHGIKVSNNVDRSWIIKNNVYNLGGDSIQIGNATVATIDRSKDTYIADNDFYENLENGVDVKAADNTLILGNRIWGFIHHKNNSSTGIGIVIHSKAEHTWVVKNVVNNSAGGITTTDGSIDTWIIGNVIKDIKHATWDTDWSGGLYDSGAAIHFRGGSTGGVINNTIINYDKGIETASGQYVFINNILFNRNSEQGHDFFVESSKSNNLTSNNLVFSNAASLKQVNVTCVSCLYEAPSFIDLSHNVAISDNSVALAAGMSIQSYLDKYKNTFGVELNKDIYNGERIVGGIEIGAMEEQNSIVGGDQSIPLSPDITNIKINN